MMLCNQLYCSFVNNVSTMMSQHNQEKYAIATRPSFFVGLLVYTRVEVNGERQSWPLPLETHRPDIGASL